MGRPAALPAGVVVRVDQAVIVVHRLAHHRAFRHPAAFAAREVVGVHQAVIVLVVVHGSVLLFQAWWNWAASVLSRMAVVLAVPPLAALATASK